MLERVIENWLTKASEKSVQLPFCYMLSKKGISVVHLTRHWSMEKGKDIIAKDTENNIYAYQLKSPKNGRITMGQWQGINKQLFDLVTLDIDHVGIKNDNHHRSFLVTNGFIDEDVSTAIKDFNRYFEKKNQPECRLEVYSRADLFDMAKELGNSLWPSELTDVQTFLEMHLANGKGLLPKVKLAKLFESTFKLNENISNSECERIISGAAIICALSLNNFTNENNYVTEIEAWIIYISYVFSLVQKNNLSDKHWKNSVDLALMQIYALLENLCEELRARKNYIEGDFPSDIIFYKERITQLTSLMSIYGLLNKFNIVSISKENEDFIGKFCLDNVRNLCLWGEGVIPQLISCYWFYRKLDATQSTVFFLKSIIKAIIKRNKNGSITALPCPYYDVEEIYSNKLGVKDEPIFEKFDGFSYMLEGLFNIFVRHNYKNSARILWSEYSKIKSICFEPEKEEDFFRWNNLRGKTKIKEQKRIQKWDLLKAESMEYKEEWVPQLLRSNPILSLLFLIVFPHRSNSKIFRWLDSKIDG